MLQYKSKEGTMKTQTRNKQTIIAKAKKIPLSSILMEGAGRRSNGPPNYLQKGDDYQLSCSRISNSVYLIVARLSENELYTKPKLSYRPTKDVVDLTLKILAGIK